MDSVMVIRIVAGVLFVAVLGALDSAPPYQDQVGLESPGRCISEAMAVLQAGAQIPLALGLNVLTMVGIVSCSVSGNGGVYPLAEPCQARLIPRLEHAWNQHPVWGGSAGNERWR